jgi:hypothetical protein
MNLGAPPLRVGGRPSGLGLRPRAATARGRFAGRRAAPRFGDGLQSCLARGKGLPVANVN